MKKGILAGLIIVILVVAAFGTFVYVTDLRNTGPQTLNKAQSGLVASDPLNKYATQQQLQANGSYWSYGGTTGTGAYYNFYESADKLNIGIVAPNSGEWSGFYAVTPPTDAELVHAVLTASTTQVSGYYDTGLYMQATNQLINYLTCLAITTPQGTTWGVVHGYGTTLQNVVITPLWVDTSPNQPLTEDCSLVTDGQSYVRVYLDHQEVYSSNSTNLGMPGPYNFFVEEESEYAGQILYGSYQNFYATLSDKLTVTNIPSTGTMVELVNQSGQVYDTVPVSGGSATFNIGKYSYPMAAYIKVYGAAATMVGSTPLEQIYGGDTYTFGSAPPSTVSLNVNAQDASGHDLNGFYVAISQGHNAISNGSTPWTFTGLGTSQTYTVTAYDYGNYVFDHWSNGQTSREISLSITKNTNLVAIYRDVNSAPPPGQTAVTVDAVSSGGAPVTGLSVTVWRDGVLFDVSYSPANFDLTTGDTYLIAAAGYGGYTFSHWGDGTTNAYYQFTPKGQSMTLTADYSGSG